MATSKTSPRAIDRQGTKTTELWLAIASGVMLIAGALKDVIPPEQAGWALVMVGGIYTAARTVVKVLGR